jgi:hypothetical protein
VSSDDEVIVLFPRGRKRRDITRNQNESGDNIRLSFQSSTVKNSWILHIRAMAGKDAKVKIPQKGEMGFPKAGFSPPAAGNATVW